MDSRWCIFALHLYRLHKISANVVQICTTWSHSGVFGDQCSAFLHHISAFAHHAPPIGSFMFGDPPSTASPCSLHIKLGRFLRIGRSVPFTADYCGRTELSDVNWPKSPQYVFQRNGKTLFVQNCPHRGQKGANKVSQLLSVPFCNENRRFSCE
jgi:hypothetical protein